jgi:hypothetical protein
MYNARTHTHTRARAFESLKLFVPCLLLKTNLGQRTFELTKTPLYVSFVRSFEFQETEDVKRDEAFS